MVWIKYAYASIIICHVSTRMYLFVFYADITFIEFSNTLFAFQYFYSYYINIIKALLLSERATVSSFSRETRV